MRLKKFIELDDANIVIKPVSDCSKEEINMFFDMVDDANEAYISKSDVKRYGKLLGFYYIDDDLAAVSAIKKPYRRRNTFENANVTEDPNDYPYELGWSYTKPEYQRQGISYKLSMTLIKKINTGVFATVRTTNNESIKNLIKRGFRKIGDPMDVGVFSIFLFIREKI